MTNPDFDPPSSLALSREAVFIVRRAVRRGSVSRADLCRAFSLSSATGTRLLRETEKAFGPNLFLDGKVTRWSGEAPPWASAEALLQEIEGGLDPSRSGFFHPELPVNLVNFVSNTPGSPLALSQIISALTHERPLRVLYVGLRRDAKAEWRQVMPLGLERMADQWRLIADDLDDADGGHPTKTFVLSRILEVLVAGRLPKDYVGHSFLDAGRNIEIPLRTRAALTLDQQKAIENELLIKNGHRTIPARVRFEFLRRFAEIPASPDAVWPLVETDPS